MAIATASASRIPIADYVTGIPAGDRALLARAITLVESTNPEHGRLAQNVLQELLPKTGNAVRLGITGVPGVGKSTTIDQLGMNLIADGHLVAVLAIDPTSKRSGGSILGDKTRMSALAQEKNAFIRPSPASGTSSSPSPSSSGCAISTSTQFPSVLSFKTSLRASESTPSSVSSSSTLPSSLSC